MQTRIITDTVRDYACFVFYIPLERGALTFPGILRQTQFAAISALFPLICPHATAKAELRDMQASFTCDPFSG